MVPHSASHALFWIALGFTVGGFTLSMASVAVIVARALRGRRSWENKIERGTEALLGRERAQQALERNIRGTKLYRQGPAPNPPPPIPNDEADKHEIDRKYEKLFIDATGRSTKSLRYVDTMLMPEHMALTVTQDQIEQLRSPVLLAALGVVISTAGSIVALWV